MARTISDIRQAVRQLIRDEFQEGTALDFEDDEIDVQIGHVLEEISDKRPYQVIEAVKATANSKRIDLSEIDELIKVRHAEYPIGDDPANLCNVKYLDGNTIEMVDPSGTPDESGESGTLTGTITFTKGSATVTGSGTDFDGELEEDNLIKPSDGTRWYRIYSIESDTSLTLDEPVKSEDNGADTEDGTQYCTEPVFLYCDKLHILTDSKSTLPANVESVLIDGVAANTALAWVNNVRTHVREAVTRITDINQAIDDMSNRIQKAISDLNEARGYVNEVTVGGNPLSDLAGTAGSELNVAGTSLNKASGYLREQSSRLSIAGVINSYQNWANNKLALYRQRLESITPLRVHRSF